MTVMGLPETNSKKVIRSRADRSQRPAKDAPNFLQDCAQAVSLQTLWKPFSLTFTEPVVLFIHLYASLVNILQYLWLESFPVIFSEQYHFSTADTGLAFLGLVVGAFASVPLLFWWIYRNKHTMLDANGCITPEKRLLPAKAACFMVPISLFWFGWTAMSRTHWILPIVGSGFFSSAETLLYVSVAVIRLHLRSNQGA